MNRFLPALAIVTMTQVCLAEQTKLDEDLTELQGRWEMLQVQNEVERRVVKTIEDKTETVEVYDNGILTQKHVVDISIERSGSVKICQWKNGRIVGGPNEGKNLPDGRFIYRLEDKTWIAVHGMIQGDRGPIILEIFIKGSKM